MTDEKLFKGFMGMNFLITAGPTVEEIDPVRFISNYSTGRQGYEMAKTVRKMGGNVILVSGPTNLTPPEHVKFVQVKTAIEMRDACMREMELQKIDVLIAVAAVSDFRVSNKSNIKISRSNLGKDLDLKLVANPDILREIGNSPLRPKLVIGFALESEDLIENAENKRLNKKCDWIIANSTKSAPYRNDINSIFLIKDQVIKEFHNKTKAEISTIIADEIIEELDELS